MIPYNPPKTAENADKNSEMATAANGGETCENGTPFNTPKQLLDYCMKHGDDPSNLPPDPNRLDRLSWLKNVWSNMSVDLVAKLKQSLEILDSHANLETLTDEQIEKVEEAFSEVESICEDMDFANDFLKVGAGPILFSYLRSSYQELRFASCNLIATLAQHNAFAQAEIINNCQLVPVLFDALVSDPDGNVRLKALYAISALTRENKAGVAEFVKHDGFIKLAAAINEQTVALTSKTERDASTATQQKLILKSTFLINNVVNSDALTARAEPNYVALCVQLATTYRHFVTSITAHHSTTDSEEDDATLLNVCESIASCLLTLAKHGGRPAFEALRGEALHFDETLAQRIEQLRATHAADKDEPSREELEYAIELRTLLTDSSSRRNDALAACV